MNIFFIFLILTILILLFIFFERNLYFICQNNEQSLQNQEINYIQNIKYPHYLNNHKFNFNFYNYQHIFPFLRIFKLKRTEILQEINKNLNYKKKKGKILNLWHNWPEKNLYHQNMSWKIIPFYGFNYWVSYNCTQYPIIYNLLKNIKGLRTAILSKLGKKTILEKHQGWAELSNNVLRVHYGIVVPNECYIGVENEKKKLLIIVLSYLTILNCIGPKTIQIMTGLFLY